MENVHIVDTLVFSIEDQGMLRFEMIQAFIRIAHFKFRSSNAELHALSITHALELLLAEHIIPFADKSKYPLHNTIHLVTAD